MNGGCSRLLMKHAKVNTQNIGETVETWVSIGGTSVDHESLYAECKTVLLKFAGCVDLISLMKQFVNRFKARCDRSVAKFNWLAAVDHRAFRQWMNFLVESVYSSLKARIPRAC